MNNFEMFCQISKNFCTPLTYINNKKSNLINSQFSFNSIWFLNKEKFIQIGVDLKKRYISWKIEILNLYYTATINFYKVSKSKQTLLKFIFKFLLSKNLEI